jgi:glutaredoxin
MKVFLFVTMFATTTAVFQSSHRTVTTVFYFGGSDCPHCIEQKNIDNINKMKAELPKKYEKLSFKFVLVVMDKHIERGIRYAQKYGSWDEISIGQFYNNELMLQHVNRAQIPGVPHIMIYKDSLNIGKYNIPTIERRTLLVDLAGELSIDHWIRDGYPLYK